jgi:gamma-glutamyltranspeptidase/glutathione hydrolase
MGGGLVPASYAPPTTMRPTLVGDRWAVVGGHPLVSQVAAQVLAAGGNAVDAGVAAGLASNVVQVDMANFGGIAPVLVRTAGSAEVYSVAGVGRWSREADLAELRTRYGGDLPLGGAPCIVPGAPAAWIASLERFGTWSFADVAAPAIELAQRGFPLDLRTAESLRIMGAGFSRWSSTARIYWPQGRPPSPGERLVQADLADLLTELVEAERGPSRRDALRAVHNRFYTGPIARTIVDFVTEAGGYLAESDLAQFDAEVAPAPSRTFAGWDVHVTPTWSQGAIVTTALGILEGFDLADLEHNGPRHLHLVAEALGLAFSDRELYFADPDFMAVELGDLQSDERLRQLRSLVSDRAQAALATRSLPVQRLRSTTSVVVTDEAGTTFATSPSDTLDGGPIIPGLGIMCSPRGVQSRLDEAHPNSLQPGKRPCVTPAAMIAVREGAGGEQDVWGMACPGGDVIVQAMVQVALNVAVFDMPPQEAVEAARIAPFNAPSAFHPHPQADNVVFAEGRIPLEVRESLAAAGHNVRAWPDYEFDAGSVQLTLSSTHPHDGRTVLAAADPRRTAYGIVR